MEHEKRIEKVTIQAREIIKMAKKRKRKLDFLERYIEDATNRNLTMERRMSSLETLQQILMYNGIHEIAEDYYV